MIPTTRFPFIFRDHADKALQERLADSTDLYDQALLLMRKTGVRIGELTSLEYHCVRSDHLGHHFLKVPLGKLNTERLVPLDHTALAIIDKLQNIPRPPTGKIFLLETTAGHKTGYLYYSKALKQACQGLQTNGKVVTHRLRHTYATSLLAAGISLVVLMKLLGHKDIQMTLRYAQITHETIGKEYLQAIAKMEHRYTNILNTSAHGAPDKNPVKLLNDAIHLIRSLAADSPAVQTLTRLIVKRLQRIQTEIHTLFLLPS